MSNGYTKCAIEHLKSQHQVRNEPALEDPPEVGPPERSEGGGGSAPGPALADTAPMNILGEPNGFVCVCERCFFLFLVCCRG